jgi:hypothetical protein
MVSSLGIFEDEAMVKAVSQIKTRYENALFIREPGGMGREEF